MLMGAKCCPFREGKNELAAPDSTLVSRDSQCVTFCSPFPRYAASEAALPIVCSSVSVEGVRGLLICCLPYFVYFFLGNRKFLS